MLKKTITYTDYNDRSRTEDFWFNLSRTEILDMAICKRRDLGKLLSDIITESDPTKFISLIEDLIQISYGRKSEDGKRFIKSEELTRDFTQTEAYSELLVDLALNADKAVEFVNAIIPTKFIQEINARAEENSTGGDPDAND